jgi:hypothetical protein
MPTTAYVKPIGGEGAGEVLVSQDIPMGRDFGYQTKFNRVSLDEAVTLLGSKVVERFIDDLDWVDWDDIREQNKEPQ